MIHTCIYIGSSCKVIHKMSHSLDKRPILDHGGEEDVSTLRTGSVSDELQVEGGTQSTDRGRRQ